MRTIEHWHGVVVGGGIYGCRAALELARSGARVLLVERAADLLSRASYANQARIHNGYHYPRSVLTAVRSRVNFPRFCDEYAGCVVDDFEAYYAVAARISKVTSRQFRTFCDRIGATLRPAPEAVRRLFNSRTVDAVYAAREYAFDADRLRAAVRAQLDEAGVTVMCEAEAERIEPLSTRVLRVSIARRHGPIAVETDHVLNCTYSRINRLLRASSLPPVPLKHEVTEMALVDPPEELRDKGVTVMCGPFFSIMPFPARKLHSLSHVRYTPHFEWRDDGSRAEYLDPYSVLERADKHTAFPSMVRDAARYLPCLEGCQYVDSIWEVKTVLPQSDVDDSRPILMQAARDDRAVISLMGSKVDNIYEVALGAH